MFFFAPTLTLTETEQSTCVLVQDNKFTKVSWLKIELLLGTEKKYVYHMGCFEWCLLYQNQVPE